MNFCEILMMDQASVNPIKWFTLKFMHENFENWITLLIIEADMCVQSMPTNASLPWRDNENIRGNILITQFVTIIWYYKTL